MDGGGDNNTNGRRTGHLEMPKMATFILCIFSRACAHTHTPYKGEVRNDSDIMGLWASCSSLLAAGSVQTRSPWGHPQPSRSRRLCAEEEPRGNEGPASVGSLEFKRKLSFPAAAGAPLASPSLWAAASLALVTLRSPVPVLSPSHPCTGCSLPGCPFLLCLPGKLLLIQQGQG